MRERMYNGISDTVSQRVQVVIPQYNIDVGADRLYPNGRIGWTDPAKFDKNSNCASVGFSHKEMYILTALLQVIPITDNK